MGLNIGIGECRSAVEIIQNIPVDNESGGQQDNWSTSVITRGRLRKKTGKKINEAGALIFEEYYELVIRWQQAVIVNSDTRVLVDGKNYLILDMETVKQVQHWIVFKLSISNA